MNKRFEDLTPGEQLYFELSNIIEDDVPQLPRGKQKSVIMGIIERMIDAAQTGHFPTDLQVQLLQDIDTTFPKRFVDITAPLLRAIQQGIADADQKEGNKQ